MGRGTVSACTPTCLHVKTHTFCLFSSLSVFGSTWKKPRQCPNCICASSPQHGVQLKGALTPFAASHSSGVGQGTPPTQGGRAGELLRVGLQRERQGGRRELDKSHGETEAWGQSEKGCGAGGEGHGVGLGGPWAASQGAAASRPGPRFGSFADGSTARL